VKDSDVFISLFRVNDQDQVVYEDLNVDEYRELLVHSADGSVVKYHESNP
jgi:hypothetical protein